MQILLDTHVFLWAITDDPRLGAFSWDLISSKAGVVMLSHVSLREIAIKHTLARTDMSLSAAQAIAWTEASGFELLPLALQHILTLERLPLHHHDPFDRLLLAQAISEHFTLLSADAAFEA